MKGVVLGVSEDILAELRGRPSLSTAARAGS
jgi:hypothetical protein